MKIKDQIEIMEAKLVFLDIRWKCLCKIEEFIGNLLDEISKATNHAEFTRREAKNNIINLKCDEIIENNNPNH